MKYLVIILVALLPLHAIIVTTLKCKFGINTDFFRFWKEFILIFLFIVTFFKTLYRFKWNISKLYKDNYIIGVATTFSLISFIFIFFPFFEPKLASFLGFKYDVFFIIALVIGLYLPDIKNNLNIIFKTLFTITGLILIIFLPWYLFGDISTITSIFGFSSEASTYTANGCISFSQNVKISDVISENRFQGSFAGPIRWSVFLTTFYLIFLGFILNKKENNYNLFKNKDIKNEIIFYLLIIIASIFIITSIFYSYSKTTILGLFFGILSFSYLIYKIKLGKEISTKFLSLFGIISSMLLIILLIVKKDVFLHLGSVINRIDNLKVSVEMFLWNPFGYGLGIAGPASWTGQSIESAGSWQIAIASTNSVHKFLPENWFVQILLEQGIVGLVVFISLMIIIGLKLFEIVKIKKDYLSIGIFSSFITLILMANFTHAFEESATSYILFLIIGAYIAKNNLIKRRNK